MNAWQTSLFNPEEIMKRFNNRDCYKATYFDSKVGNLANSYLNEMMDQVEMSSLVKVMDNCHYSQRHKLCPVLI